MNKSLLVALFLLAANAASSQDEKIGTVKQFYTEMGGPGILFSANFDTRFTPEKRTGLGMRIGVGFTIKWEDYWDQNGDYHDGVSSIPTIPVGINYLLGSEKSPHTFEIGAGATFLTKKTDMLNYSSNEKRGNVMGYFAFMYRRQPLYPGVTWRIGFTPLINTAGDIVPFGAVGIGYCFK